MQDNNEAGASSAPMTVDEALAIVSRAVKRADNPGQVLAAEVERLHAELGPLRTLLVFAQAYMEVRDSDPDGAAWYCLALAIDRAAAR